MSDSLMFPKFDAATFPALQDEPEFDEHRHLKLEAPSTIIRLQDLGYREGAPLCASDVAMTSAFSVLSDEGADVMTALARRYKQLQTTTEGNPDAAYVKPRGCAYSCRFVRSLLGSPRIIEFFSDIVGTQLTAHTIPSIAATIVFSPSDHRKTNQGWHLDSAGPFSVVIALNKPGEMLGGAFEYFQGTNDEVAGSLDCSLDELRTSVGRLGTLAKERIKKVEFGRAGDGILMQGPLVLHRGEPLRAAAERMVLVMSYASVEVDRADSNHWREIQTWNSPTLHTEFARHKIWRTRRLLETSLRDLPVDADRVSYAEAIDKALLELTTARDVLRS